MNFAFGYYYELRTLQHHWHCSDLSARTILALMGHRELHSSSGGELLVPCVKTLTAQHHVFSIVAPSI